MRTVETSLSAEIDYCRPLASCWPSHFIGAIGSAGQRSGHSCIGPDHLSKSRGGGGKRPPPIFPTCPLPTARRLANLTACRRGGQLRRLSKAVGDVVEHIDQGAAVKATVASLIDPVADQKANAHDKGSAHSKCSSAPPVSGRLVTNLQSGEKSNEMGTSAAPRCCALRSELHRLILSRMSQNKASCTEQLLVHLTPELRDRIEAIAREEGRSLSNTARRLLERSTAERGEAAA